MVTTNQKQNIDSTEKKLRKEQYQSRSLSYKKEIRSAKRNSNDSPKLPNSSRVFYRRENRNESVNDDKPRSTIQANHHSNMFNFNVNSSKMDSTFERD